MSCKMSRLPADHSLDARLSPSALLSATASCLMEMCKVNDALTLKSNAQGMVVPSTPVSRFHSVCIPQISIEGYLNRIRRYCVCSNTCYIIALLYIDRAQKNGSIVINSLTIHRLMIAGVMLASKFYDDEIQKNKAYAMVGGLSTLEMNRLEIELLNALEFDLNIDIAHFDAYQQALVSRAESLASPPSSPRPPVVCLSPDCEDVLSQSDESADEETEPARFIPDTSVCAAATGLVHHHGLSPRSHSAPTSPVSSEQCFVRPERCGVLAL